MDLPHLIFLACVPFGTTEPDKKCEAHVTKCVENYWKHKRIRKKFGDKETLGVYLWTNKKKLDEICPKDD